MKKSTFFGRLKIMLVVLMAGASLTAVAQRVLPQHRDGFLRRNWFEGLVAKMQETLSNLGDVYRYSAWIRARPTEMTYQQPVAGPTVSVYSTSTIAAKTAPVPQYRAVQTAESTSSSSLTNALPPATFSSTLSFATLFNVLPGELPPIPVVPTASGTWTANASGNWGTASNWSGNVIADGAGNAANFNATDITTDVTVTLDTSRTIGTLSIGDTNGTHHYTIAPGAGTSLTFDNVNSAASLTQTATSAGDTISAPIFFNSDLDITNLSSNVLTLSGNLASSAGGSSFPTLSFAGNVTVSGNISNGTTGATVTVAVNSGTVIFSGTNTYTGGNQISGGMLLINGNNSGATGSTQVFSPGILGGTGTMAGSVFTFGGTITGGTDTTVGTLTLLNNVFISTGEGGGTYLANLLGNMSDLLAITGNLSLGEDSTLNIVGTADGVTTYTLATFDMRTGFGGSTEFETVTGVPLNYMLVYHDHDIQLVPVPEPATWAGAALALAAVALARRRKAKKLKS